MATLFTLQQRRLISGKQPNLLLAPKQRDALFGRIDRRRNYDERGLFDPLVLASYFTAQSDLIVPADHSSQSK
jgi:hypothetical protein